MISSSSRNEVRRCRPLLGTFVEIWASISGWEPCSREIALPDLPAAVNGAFAAVERVQQLMSAHDPNSELSTVNREALRHPVRVSCELHGLLRQANGLADASDGAFDHTVAPLLAQWGFLPDSLRRRNPGNWSAVRLLKGRRVSFTSPAALDLGGIAKGFAVDEAVRVLKQHGVHNAVVNAGGDLRVLGSRPVSVHLRNPSASRSRGHRLELAGTALATSSPCFTERRWRGKPVSHLVNPHQRSAVTGGVSVTVRAPECWLADGLTKVLLNSPLQAEKLLSLYDATAIVLTT